MILIFFGPPGAGKGTQASLTSKSLNIPHLSTGDILRSKILDNDSLANKLKFIIDSGNLVSDDILNTIIADRLNSSDCKNGFVLDGYPRTIKQKDFLINFLKLHKLKISKIFEFKIDESNIIKRIKLRSNIENRQDDRDEVIKTRINKYLQKTKPLSDYFSLNYPLDYHVINGSQQIQKIQDDILKITKK